MTNDMKHLLIIFFIIFLSLGLSAQTFIESETPNTNFMVHSKKDIRLSLSGNMLFNNPYESVFAGGVKMKMFVGKRISFDSDLLFGKNYVHFGPGIIGLPLWIFSNEIGFSSEKEGSFELFLFTIAMMALSAEHVAYHYPVSNNIEFSPYLSLLRFKQLSIGDEMSNSRDDNAHASFAAGMELNRYYKHLVVSPYLEYNLAYDGYISGVNFGINVGYYFSKHNE